MTSKLLYGESSEKEDTDIRSFNNKSRTMNRDEMIRINLMNSNIDTLTDNF